MSVSSAYVFGVIVGSILSTATVLGVLHLVGIPSQYDVNRDGAVNIKDLSSLERYITEKNYGHPVGTP